MITNDGLRILMKIFFLRKLFFCIFSELNLRIWQESKKMFEKTGKRPIVYNNKCGQMCGVSLDDLSKHFLNYYPFFSVAQKRFELINN
jgi:hypothetical protein